MKQDNNILMLRYILPVALLFTIACNKKKDLNDNVAAETGDATVKVVNRMSDSVYLTLSGQDILTGVLPHTMIIELRGNDSITLKPDQLKSGYRYRYAWHTAGYRAGSWMIVDLAGRQAEPSFDYRLSGTDTSFDINGSYRDELLICLDGDGKSSTWKAVDAFDKNGVSVWGTMTAKQQDHSFTISRFYTVKHRFTDTANKPATTNLAFYMDVSKPRLWFSVAYTSDSFVLTNDLSPLVQLSTTARTELFYARRVADPVTGTVSYPGPYYKLIRESVEK